MPASLVFSAAARRFTRLPARTRTRRYSLSPLRELGFLLVIVALASPFPARSEEQSIRGRVQAPDGGPIPAARVTLRQGTPFHERTVSTNADGIYETTLQAGEPFTARVRRIGWRDVRLADVAPLSREEASHYDFQLERVTDPGELAEQLPANRWFSLLLGQFEDEEQREEFVRQCTYCHQQGSPATRLLREDEEWQKVLSLMARMGATLSPELRDQIPELWRRAYDPAHAVPALTQSSSERDFAPAPDANILAAVVDEWELGHPASMQHDLAVHPDGRVYSVDMMQDKLYRFDPKTGARTAFSLPHSDLPLGGIFGAAGGPLPPNANARFGPHSLQVAPDGAIWATLALGGQLGRFDTATEEWQIHELEEGIYPHTLRFDQQGQIWYTMAVSNHVGVLDPASGKQRSIRLPTTSFSQALTLRAIPVALWLGQYIDIFGMAGGEGGGSVRMPVPYGIDVAPDGGIWFSQLNEHRIGRIDPDTLDVEMIDTPFSAPRRLRFDSQGRLWIPGFSSGLVSRFDPKSRDFKNYTLPIEPLGTETPYALNVHLETDTVWICGTNSDTLIRFEPETETFSVYPLPTRVTYTREIDFDAEGRVWTSNSNLPAWQIEGGIPRILRLDPSAPTAEARRASDASSGPNQGPPAVTLAGGH